MDERHKEHDKYFNNTKENKKELLKRIIDEIESTYLLNHLYIELVVQEGK